MTRALWVVLVAVTGCGGDTSVHSATNSDSDAGMNGTGGAPDDRVPSACIFNENGPPQPIIEQLDPGTISVACLGRSEADVLSIHDSAGQGFDWKATVESPNGFFSPNPDIGSACPGFALAGIGNSGVIVAPPAGALPGDSDEGTLTVVTSAPSIGPLTASVRAVVVATSFRVTPVALEFGQVAQGGNAQIALTVENTGTVPILLDPSPWPTAPFSVQYWGPHGEDSPPAPKLDPGQSGQMLTFVFSPTKAGVATLELDLTPFPSGQTVAPECGAPVHVTLKGEGVLPADAGAVP